MILRTVVGVDDWTVYVAEYDICGVRMQSARPGAEGPEPRERKMGIRRQKRSPFVEFAKE